MSVVSQCQVFILPQWLIYFVAFNFCLLFLRCPGLSKVMPVETLSQRQSQAAGAHVQGHPCLLCQLNFNFVRSSVSSTSLCSHDQLDFTLFALSSCWRWLQEPCTWCWWTRCLCIWWFSQWQIPSWPYVNVNIRFWTWALLWLRDLDATRRGGSRWASVVVPRKLGIGKWRVLWIWPWKLQMGMGSKLIYIIMVRWSLIYEQYFILGAWFQRRQALCQWSLAGIRGLPRKATFAVANVEKVNLSVTCRSRHGSFSLQSHTSESQLIVYVWLCLNSSFEICGCHAMMSHVMCSRHIIQ